MDQPQETAERPIHQLQPQPDLDATWSVPADDLDATWPIAPKDEPRGD